MVNGILTAAIIDLWLKEAALRFFGLILACAFAIAPGIAAGQIVTDGSLGDGRSLSGPVFRIPPSLADQRGGNLFHSFRSFNVGDAEVAVFGVPGDVDAVIGRVTGGEVSAINGAISFVAPGTTNPVAADFWFFNPNGVAIGAGAESALLGGP